MEFKSDHFKINERYGQGLYIGRIFDTTKFSDEYCKYDEFTGTMVGITCADRVKYKHYADFDFFEYIETAKSDCLEQELAQITDFFSIGTNEYGI